MFIFRVIKIPSQNKELGGLYVIDVSNSYNVLRFIKYKI